MLLAHGDGQRQVAGPLRWDCCCEAILAAVAANEDREVACGECVCCDRGITAFMCPMLDEPVTQEAATPPGN